MVYSAMHFVDRYLRLWTLLLVTIYKGNNAPTRSKKIAYSLLNIGMAKAMPLVLYCTRQM